MEKEILNLNKLEAKEGVLTVIKQTLPTPHLEKLHEEQQVELAGTISAPANFYEKRTGEINNLKSHVIFDYEERTIVLRTIEDYDNLGSIIKGELMENPALESFGLNMDKTFFVSDMVKHLRQRKHLFASTDQHKKIVDQLQNFSANVNAEIKKINTNNGNIEDVTKITMKSNLELNFELLMPVFIGEENKKFPVEIACSANNTQIKFWFESNDLIVLLEQDTKSIIDAEIARLKTASKDELVFIQQ